MWQAHAGERTLVIMTRCQIPSPDHQLKVLLRGAVDVHVEQELTAKLHCSWQKQKPLCVKAGFDPTAPDLHLGHLVLFNKLRQFQDLGHTVIFVVGDFTARIGDPTGKNKTRPPLSPEEIASNCQTYKEQVFRVLDPAQTEIRCNSEWLGALGLEQILKLCAMCSLARLIERDDFAKRLAAQKSLAMHELLYPLMQAYDSVVLRADVELGGTDQLFNLLMGRHLMRQMDQRPQCVLTMPLLEGLDAREQDGKIVGQKMSKSLGNAVGVTENPREQFGKLLSMADAVMWRYFALLSSRSSYDIEQLRTQHPKQAKEALALELVGRLHSPQEAQAAKEHFDALFGAGKRGLIPQDTPPIVLPLPPEASEGGIPLFHVLHQADLAPSRAEAKRLIRQNAVTVDGATVNHLNHSLKGGGRQYQIRVGKTRWGRVEIGKSS